MTDSDNKTTEVDAFLTGGFAAKIMNRGSFDDTDPAFDGKVYRVEAVLLRLNPAALGEYLNSRIRNERDTYETDKEWQEYLSKKKTLQNDFQNKICAICDYPADRAVVTQSHSEVFTAVYVHRIK